MKCQAFSVEASVIKLTEHWWIELIVEINNNDNVFAILDNIEVWYGFE